jgi:hypothetical protein
LHGKIIADNLSKAGWSWGCVSVADTRNGPDSADAQLSARIELELPRPYLNISRKGAAMKSYISRIAVAASLGISVLPALTPSAQPQTRPWWYYGCPKGVVAQIPGDVPGPGTAGWTQYQSCLQQNLSVSPQQSAQIAPILANEGRKVMAIRNNNSFSDVQKIQEITSLQKQSDPQLKAILSSAQYDKLKVVRYQAVRWVTQKRLGWQ